MPLRVEDQRSQKQKLFSLLSNLWWFLVLVTSGLPANRKIVSKTQNGCKKTIKMFEMNLLCSGTHCAHTKETVWFLWPCLVFYDEFASQRNATQLPFNEMANFTTSDRLHFCFYLIFHQTFFIYSMSVCLRQQNTPPTNRETVVWISIRFSFRLLFSQNHKNLNYDDKLVVVVFYKIVQKQPLIDRSMDAHATAAIIIIAFYDCCLVSRHITSWSIIVFRRQFVSIFDILATETGEQRSNECRNLLDSARTYSGDAWVSFNFSVKSMKSESIWWFKWNCVLFGFGGVCLRRVTSVVKAIINAPASLCDRFQFFWTILIPSLEMFAIIKRMRTHEIKPPAAGQNHGQNIIRFERLRLQFVSHRIEHSQSPMVDVRTAQCDAPRLWLICGIPFNSLPWMFESLKSIKYSSFLFLQSVA